VSRAWEPVIGLEIHAQLLTRSKIFCACPTTFGAPPNSHTCPVCTGLPGVLPVLNRRVVEFGLTAAAAFGCDVPERSIFARKNYFYPDLPKGYQVSQFEAPLALGGGIEIDVDGATRFIRLTRIHMEEDAGKLVHGRDLGDPSASFVDLNRAGVPLLEIVTEPDLRTPAEAAAFMAAMREVVVFLGICDGNMEEGSLRCDANVSIRPAGETALGVKAEVKNINSFRFVQKALEYEIDRQVDLLESGGRVVQETRLFDADRGVTFSMRGKEEAHDYRYFPEPDLVPLVVDREWFGRVRQGLPELPRAMRRRLEADFGLSGYDAGVITQDPDLARFFGDTVAAGAPPKKAANWIMGELLRLRREAGKDAGGGRVTPAALAALVALVDQGAIGGAAAKEVFAEVFRTGADPARVVEERGLAQVSDQGAIEALVDEVLAANPGEVAAFRGGKANLLGFFVGQVMRRSGGTANPGVIGEILRRKLQ
jgi:aspartyl-tRNA(Asn)/glutamyl-tRNA(Gln) amidotransferase subunit B